MFRLYGLLKQCGFQKKEKKIKRLMDNYMKIFHQILWESSIPRKTQSLLLDKTYEINFDLYEDKSRHYRVEFVVEESSKTAVRSEIKKFKNTLTPLFKKKLICNSIKFEISEKIPNKLTDREKQQRALDLLSEWKENQRSLKKQKQFEKKEIGATWKEVIDNQKKIKEGYIYILSNVALSSTYKIGFVKEDVFKRAYSLRRETGITTDFVIEKTWKTKNPYEVEQKIFESLQMQKNEKGEYDSSFGKCYRTSKVFKGKTFNEFVDGASLKFFCKRIEKFIQD